METVLVEKYELVKEFEKPPKDTRFVVSLLIPGIIIFSLAILFPIVTGIFISFTDSSASTGFFGKRMTLVNYYELLTYGNFNTRRFWQYTYQTLFFSIVSLVIEFFLGLIFALILNKKFKGRGIARATILIPWAIPTIASATIFRFEIFNTAGEYGLINSIIVSFGGRPVDFFGPDAAIFNLSNILLFVIVILLVVLGIIISLALIRRRISAPLKKIIIIVSMILLLLLLSFAALEVTMTMFTAIFIDVWKTTPFITLLILATLQIVPQDLYKAGEIAGASGWQKFRHITWPLIRPGVGVALIFRMMQALRVYDAIVVFNDTSVRSMTSHSVLLWLNGDFAMASAVSVLLLGFIALFALVITLLTRREKRTSSKRKTKFLKFGKRVEEPAAEEEIKPEEFHSDDDYKKNNIIPYDIEIETKIEPISESTIKWYIRKRRAKKGFFIFLAVFMCLFCAGPFIWIVIRSFRDPYIIQTHFELFPEYLSFRAYEVIFQSSDVYGVTFERALLNGLILSGTTVVVVLIVGSFVAYAIAKFDFRFKKILNSFIFSMNSLPPLIIIIPFYIQIISIATILPFFDLRDNLFGLVLPYAAFNLPLAIFILIAFFREIPEDLWKAAKVDGASNFRIFRKIILPLTLPGIFTSAILVFIASWNELLFAQIFLTDPQNHTVPRAILRYLRNPQSLTADWDTDIALLAATTISTIPLVVVVLIFQKKIVSGLTRGAVKG
ncbi:MAG: ABC transporter permease subunit [Candidatus Lokiarchaeota archaeon]|nr:ABC transporter permease subunit [Candidatus Lokiarchaeota archaeon]